MMELIAFHEITDNPYFKILLVVIFLDIISGISRAIVQKVLNSSIGTVGLLKHMLIVVTLGVITGFAPLVELGIVANGFIMFYLFQYGVSIVENWEAVGLPVPSGLKKFLDKRKKELDEREYDK